MAHDVFISYSRKDEKIVDEICKALDKAKISYWIDKIGIISGEEFYRVLVKAVKDSKITVFVSSEYSNISKYTVKEIVLAFNYDKYIIPFCYDNTAYAEALEFILCDLDQVQYYIQKELAIQKLVKSINMLVNSIKILIDEITENDKEGDKEGDVPAVEIIKGYKILPGVEITRPNISSLLAKNLINKTEVAWLESAGDNAWLPSGRIKMTTHNGEYQVVGNSLFFDGTKSLNAFLSDTFLFDRQITEGELSALEFIKDNENNGVVNKIKLTLSNGKTYEQDHFQAENIHMMLDTGDYNGPVSVQNVKRLDFELEAETTLDRIRYTYIEMSNGRKLCVPYNSMTFKENHNHSHHLYLNSSDKNRDYYPLSVHSIEVKDISILSDARTGVLRTYYGEKAILSSKEVENIRLTCLSSEGIQSIPLAKIDSILFHSGETFSVPYKDRIRSQMLSHKIITPEINGQIASATASFIPRGRAVIRLRNKEEIEIVANSLINKNGVPVLEYCNPGPMPTPAALSFAQITELALSDQSVWIATLADGKQVQINSITYSGSDYCCIDKNGEFMSVDSHNIVNIRFYHNEYFIPSSLPYVVAERQYGHIALPQAILLYEQLFTHMGIPLRRLTHYFPGKDFNLVFSKIRSAVPDTGYSQDKDGFPVRFVARNGENIDEVLEMGSYFCNSWLSIPTGYGRFRLHLQGGNVNIKFE